MNIKTTRLRVLLLVLALCPGLFFPGAEETAAGDTGVFITSSGEKYHREGCSSLRNSKIPAGLAEAVRAGYEPCGVCKPPRLAAGGPGPAAAPNLGAAALYRVNLAGLKSSAEADRRLLTAAEVIGHVDGDTVRVRLVNPPPGLGLVEIIRMLGVDTPETVHPSRPVEVFGQEASAFTKERLLNRRVYLAFDWDLRDRYGRLLAYIYLEDGAKASALVCHNAALIRAGYGHAYIRYPFQFIEEFRALEQEARREKRGLWGL